MKRVIGAILWTLAILAAGCHVDVPDAENHASPAVIESWRELPSKSEELRVVRGRDGWLYHPRDLRFLSANLADPPGTAEPDTPPVHAHLAGSLAALLNFAEQLEAQGIELLFVPVPTKAEIYPRGLPRRPDEPPPTREELSRPVRRYLEHLSARGVTVVDLYAPFFAAAEEAAHEDPPLYLRTDTHWSSRAVEIAAEQIAAALEGRPWLTNLEPLNVVVERRQIEARGNLRSELPEPRPAPEEIEIGFVGQRVGELLEPVPVSRHSPVVVLGDSSVLVFHQGRELHAVGAGLPDHLALRLGVEVDVVATRGSGAKTARGSLLRRPEGLAGKKAVVWCQSVRELAWDWEIIPIPQTTMPP